MIPMKDSNVTCLYLTNGMRDIDVSYLGDNKWQLFDEFDIFEFEMSV